jgi:hypothetical protein
MLRTNVTYAQFKLRQSIENHLGVGQSGGDYLDRAIIGGTKKHSLPKQDFDFAALCGEDLSRF